MRGKCTTTRRHEPRAPVRRQKPTTTLRHHRCTTSWGGTRGEASQAFWSRLRNTFTLCPFGFALPLSRPHFGLPSTSARPSYHLNGLHRHQEIILLPHSASEHTGNGPKTKRSDDGPQRMGRRLAAHCRAACRGVYSGRELPRWATLWLLRCLSSRSLADTHGDIASINSVASDMADDMMSFYLGDRPGHTPGLLPQPYYCESCPRVLFLYRPP